MPTPFATLEICGPHAAAVADDVRAAWSQEFAEPLTPTAARSTPAEFAERAADPIAVAALILTIPQTALAMHDIAQRMELVARLRRFLAFVRTKFPRDSGGTLMLRTHRGRTLLINEAEVEDFLAALEDDRL